MQVTNIVDHGDDVFILKAGQPNPRWDPSVEYPELTVLHDRSGHCDYIVLIGPRTRSPQRLVPMVHAIGTYRRPMSYFNPEDYDGNCRTCVC